jgi:hypothetical protein
MSNVVDSIITDMADSCFRINTPAVVYERFDNELVAIHMGTGVYHSMVGASAEAFVLLSEEATAVELADALATRYAATSSEILTALAPFLEELQTEQLIAPVETRKPRGPLRVAGDESGLPFVAPSLQAFKDLEGLLLLDPIHEVDDEGWPPPSQPAAK